MKSRAHPIYEARASFKWTKIVSSICCGFPLRTVRLMNSVVNRRFDRMDISNEDRGPVATHSCNKALTPYGENRSRVTFARLIQLG